jgi:MarR family transcriptional regulator for hemolysin
MHDIDLLRQDFTVALVLAARQWRRRVAEAMDGLGVSEGSVGPLLWVSRLGGGVRQIVLAEYVGIEGPSLVRLIDQLESSGYVVRRGDASDRRAKTIWLTEEGEAIARRIEERLVALRAHALEGLGREELAAGAKLLRAFAPARAASKTAA